MTTEKEVTITVNDVNEGPTDISLDSQDIDENSGAGAAVGTFSTSDVDDGDTFAYALVAGTGDTDNASFQINGDVLESAEDFDFETRNSYSIRVESTDSGGLTTEKEFAITVNDVNEAPVANDDSFGNFDEETSASTNLVSNDTDVDGDGLTVVEVGGQSITPGASVSVTNGEVSLNAGGKIVEFSPATDFNGPFNFDYTVSDDALRDSATVSGTVDPVNDAPELTMPDAQTLDEDVQTAISGLSVADVDADDGTVPALTVTLEVNNGTLNVSGAASVSGNGTVSVTIEGTVAEVSGTMGSLEYTSDQDFNGSDTLSVDVTDNGNTGSGGALTDTATVDITVNVVNDAPSFTKGPDQEVPEDAGAQTVSGWATNLDTGGGSDEDSQTLTFNVLSNSNTAMFASGPEIDGDTGDLTYTPADNANGSATIEINVKDDGGVANGGDDTSASETFQITVTPVNDAPVKIGADYTITQDEDTGSVAVDFAFGTFFDDVDVANEGDTITYVVSITDDADDWVRTSLFDTTNYNFETSNDSVSIPLHDDASGQGSLSVFARDAAGETSETLKVDITINQVLGDDTPVANDDNYTFDEDTGPHTLEVLENDDIGDGPTVVILAGVGFKDPENDGVWEQCSPNVADDPDCSQAAADNEPPLAIFHGSSGQTVRDPSSGSDVFEVNRVRCINCDSSTNSVTFDDDFTGALILYTPREDFNGTDSFQYTIKDASGETRTATVTITINPVNDIPDIVPSDMSFTMDQGTTLDVSAEDGLASRLFDRDNTVYDGNTDCDPSQEDCPAADDLFFRITQAATFDEFGNKIADIDTPRCCEGEIHYTPVASFTGTDTFNFDVCDVPFAEATSDNCNFDLTVAINVLPIDGAAEGSVEGVVEFGYDLAQSPLELPVPSIPNVVLLVDDSDSMLLDMMTPESDGIYFFSDGDSVSFIMPEVLKGQFAQSSDDLAPAEEAAPGNGLWRLRSKDYNKIYYDPRINYQPWEGLDPNGAVFQDAQPTDAPDEPFANNAQTTDLTEVQSFEGNAPSGGETETCSNPKVKVDNPDPPPKEVFCDQSITDPDDPLYCPEVCTTEEGGGTAQSNLYLPRYYVWDDKDGDGEVDGAPGWYT
ncbi:MAG: tandem-95 repeat protein, partial [Pseudomonadales bacterium]